MKKVVVLLLSSVLFGLFGSSLVEAKGWGRVVDVTESTLRVADDESGGCEWAGSLMDVVHTHGEGKSVGCLGLGLYEANCMCDYEICEMEGSCYKGRYEITSLDESVCEILECPRTDDHICYERLGNHEGREGKRHH